MASLRRECLDCGMNETFNKAHTSLHNTFHVHAEPIFFRLWKIVTLHCPKLSLSKKLFFKNRNYERMDLIIFCFKTGSL